MRGLHHPATSEIQLDQVLYALGDPVRLSIVKNLANLAGTKTPDRSCKELCQSLHLSKSTLSHHFRILRECGLILCEKEGTQHVNHLRIKDLQARFPGLLRCILKSP